jgi:hypothetical protein
MVKADAVQIALKTLKFDRFEKVYAAKLRTRVSERTLASQLGTSVPNVKVRLSKARKGALKKVLHQCRKKGKLDADRVKSLARAAGTDVNADDHIEMMKTFLSARTPSENQTREVDEFLSRVFKSETWTNSIAWRDRKMGVRASRKRIRERHEKRYTAGVEKKISWEQVGEGVLNDTVKGSATWDHWRAVMARGPKDPERRSLLNMLGSEMELLYGRYRRGVERREGKVGTFVIFGGEKRHARTVAEHCVMRDVHPVELLKYWDENIGNFTDQRYPTLAFLKGAHAVEQLAGAKSTKEKAPKDGNSYSDIEGLHPKFRRRLEEAGYRTQLYSDRHLVSVQYMASLKHRGKSFFIDGADLRRMVMWAAKHWEEVMAP